MNRNTLLAAAGAVALVGGLTLGVDTLVQASEGARVQLASAEQTAAVKERQELMKSIGGNMKTIVGFLKEAKGTAAEAQAAAAEIGELADEIPAAFETEATLDEMDAVGKNRGKPEIWLDWDGFVEQAETLQVKSTTLAAAFESGDSGTIQSALGDMGKNGCGACHEDFRGPKVE